MSFVAPFLQAVNIAGEPPSKDQLTSAHNTLKGALEKNDRQQMRLQIRQEITDLRYNAAKVEQNFATVQGVVNELDSRDMLQNNEKFGTRWDELHRRYTATLSGSNASIAELHNRIHEFVHVLLPIVESDDPDTIKRAIKLRCLDDYVRIIMAFREPAEQRGDQFFRLRDEVTAFKNNLDSVLPNSDNQLHNQRNNLNSDIANAGRKIEELRRQYDQCRDNGDVFSFFGELITSDNENRRNAIDREIQGQMNQIEGIRHQLDRLERNEECMHRIMDLLGKHNTWFDETTQKLGGMEVIWRMLVSDATILQGRLKAMEKVDASETYDLIVKRSIRPVYEALESALEAYISAL